MNYRKKINRLFVAVLCLAFGSTAFGCGDKESFTVANIGYIEDYGNQAILEEIREGSVVPKLEEFGVKEYKKPEIVLSSISAEDGKYDVQVNGESVGKTNLSNGEAVISRLSNGLELGNTYEVVLSNSKAEYKQTCKYVSKAIYNYEDLVRSINYYKTYTGSDIRESTSPDQTKEKEKFYNGETFSQRLLVLANDISADYILFRSGVGFTLASGKRDFATLLSRQDRNFFYDIFDGQGYTIEFEAIGYGGLFGRIGQNAVIKNLHLVFKPYRDWSLSVSYSMLGLTIANNVTIENVGLELNANNIETNWFSSISNYTSAGAKIKDVVISLSDGLKFKETEKLNSCGFLGGEFNPKQVENVHVISPNLDVASNDYGGKDAVYAENQREKYKGTDNFVKGCQYYIDVESILDSISIVGDWIIGSQGGLLRANSK